MQQRFLRSAKIARLSHLMGIEGLDQQSANEMAMLCMGIKFALEFPETARELVEFITDKTPHLQEPMPDNLQVAVKRVLDA